MPWFKTSDGFSSSKEVMSIPRRHRCAAAGLWTMAGSWCSKELTDGFVPAHMLAEFAATKALAGHLVAAGLWDEVSGGYQFVDWSRDQPTAADVQANRAAARDRMRRTRRANTDGSSADVRANNTRTVPVDNPREDIDRGSVEARSRLGRGSVEARPDTRREPDESGESQVRESESPDVRANFGSSSVNPARASRPDPYIDTHLGGERSVSDAPASPNVPSPELDDDASRAARAAAERLGERPAERCLRHLHDLHPPPCRRCQAKREEAEAFDAQHAELARIAGTHRRAAIAECDLCDDWGWRIAPPGIPDERVHRCDHSPDLPPAWAASLTTDPDHAVADHPEETHAHG